MTTPYTPIIPTTDAAELPVDAIHGGFTDREAIYVSPDGTQIYLVPLSSITPDCTLVRDKSAYQLGYQAALQFATGAAA